VDLRHDRPTALGLPWRLPRIRQAPVILALPLWHPWPRINRVLRVMLHTRGSAEAWSQVRVEFKKVLALNPRWLINARATT
jgi:hypothetical protein